MFQALQSRWIVDRQPKVETTCKVVWAPSRRYESAATLLPSQPPHALAGRFVAHFSDDMRWGGSAAKGPLRQWRPRTGLCLHFVPAHTGCNRPTSGTRCTASSVLGLQVALHRLRALAPLPASKLNGSVPSRCGISRREESTSCWAMVSPVASSICLESSAAAVLCLLSRWSVLRPFCFGHFSLFSFTCRMSSRQVEL